jgi:hypothetical protein
MLDVLAKFVDLLKASGWQMAMIAVACALLLYLSASGIIPDLDPAWTLVVWAGMLIAAGLAIAPLFTSLQGVAEGAWRRRQHLQAVRQAEQVFWDYIPYLTDKERQILGYLREKKLKTFVADHDGGYAGTLLARGFVTYVGVRGQSFDLDKTPMAVPEHVWKVLQQHPESFPYKPEYGGASSERVETLPWRIPWQLR